MKSICALRASGLPMHSKRFCVRMWLRRLGMTTALLLLTFGLSRSAFAGVTASILGTVKDASGAVIPGATITATNTDTHIAQAVSTNGDGSYAFPALPPGKYELSINLKGFKAFKQTGIVLNVNDAITVDATLQIGQADEVVTVTANALRVETASTQLGEVIEDKQITSIPLNGRSFTDLLALQPGVSNANSGIGGGSSTNNNFQSGGFQLPAVSGDENAGNQAVNGMRESANGYLLNGISVQEFAFSGTAIVPNLDSLSEFRIITNNFDSEYGNFAGGQINVVTKNGTNALHGNVFEYLRNTDFDAKNYLAPTRGPWQQNEFGGTAGGPLKKDKVFYFADYQANRRIVGVTQSIAVPTGQERDVNKTGFYDFSGLTKGLPTGSVIGATWASYLQGKLGYPIAAGEPYYTAGCTSNAACVFPNAKIPTSVVSPISTNVLAKGAIPLGDGLGNFSTSAYAQRLNDNKLSGRVDANLKSIGTLFGYYYFDQYSLNNPYPVANVPGFAADTTGRTQAVDIGDTKSIGSKAVNEARIGYLRVKDNLNKPAGSISATLSGLGFATTGTPGAITPLSPSLEGIPEMDFDTFSIGVPSRVLALIENTYQASDNYSLLVGNHSLKFGAAYHYTQMSEILHNVENGYFFFNSASETGNDFADFLIGAPAAFEQAQTPAGNTLSFYLGAFAQDSWRLRPNLTLNYGVRWDVISPWWEKHNEIETLSLGEQSVVFPNSPAGWVFPTDPGISKTIAPIRYNNFAPRLGLAYSPSANSGILGKLLGAPGQTSVRLGYGMFYTAFEGGYDFSVIGDAPYGAFYSSTSNSGINAPSFANPYQTRANGTINSNPFPFPFPPTNVSASNPDPGVPASLFGTIGTSPAFNPTNRVPYAEQYELSIQRQITAADLLTISYVGTQGHRLLITQEANPVNEAACLALYNPNPNLSGCSPGSEPTSLRAPYGANFASEGEYSTVGKSDYNSLQVNFQHKSGPLQVLLAYTYGQSMDTSSAFGEQGAPLAPNFNPKMTRGLSSFNIPQNFVISYTISPFDKLGGPKMLVRGWQLSGVTTFSNGLPIYLFENDDNSLLGTGYSGPLPLGIDTPNFVGGSVKKLNARSSSRSFLDSSQFTSETIGHLGTARRRFFQGPGINNFNTSLSKDTTFFDRYTLQFRAEFFNVFNHTQFNTVDGNCGSASTVTPNCTNSDFGVATSAADPRIGQLALKLQF